MISSVRHSLKNFGSFRFYSRYSNLRTCELTKRLSKNQQDKIESSFKSLTSRANIFAKDLQTNPYVGWNQSINKYSDWTRLALISRFQSENKLTDMQVGTISLVQSAVKSYLMEFQTVKVSEIKVKKGSVLMTEDKIESTSIPKQVDNPHFIAIDSNMIIFHEYLKIHLLSIINCYIDHENISADTFCEGLIFDIIKELKKAPLSENFLFLVPLDRNLDMSNYDRLLKRLLDLKSIGFPLLNIIQLEETDYLLFFSFSLMQVILDKLSPNNKAIKLTPAFGEFTSDEIFKVKKEEGKRLVSLKGLKDSSFLLMADTFQTTNFSFSLHDGYHAFKDSAILEKEIWAVFKVIEVLLRIKESQNYKDEDLEQLLFYLKDGDLEANFKCDKPWGKIFELHNIKLHLKNIYLKAIIKDIVINKSEWKKIGITREDLTESQQHIYDQLT